jgi:hypothetical protein
MAQDIPPPGLRGTYEDSCVVCLRGTDTGLVFAGEAEWAAAGLVDIGVPEDQAIATVSHGTGSEPGTVPDGDITVMFRLCQVCASKARLPVGLVASGNLPTIDQPPERRAPGRHRRGGA